MFDSKSEHSKPAFCELQVSLCLEKMNKGDASITSPESRLASKQRLLRDRLGARYCIGRPIGEPTCLFPEHQVLLVVDIQQSPYVWNLSLPMVLRYLRA
jgi:hypothetical protein